jgi:hypothetical protein
MSACSLAKRAAQAEQKVCTMGLADKRVVEKLAAFDKEGGILRWYEAFETIEAAERDVPAGDVAARKRAVSHWLSFLAALDRNIDPTWNPKDVPVKGVAPPLPHGVVYPSGEVDPLTIPDPVARAEYERALKASKEYAKWYDVQFQLRRIEERAMRFVELLLAEKYTNSAEDRQELEELLAASPVNDLRKERLRAAANWRAN